ncbi:MAG: hypothetical protein ACYTFT_09710 [Planctomycetota bacterium]
MKSGAIVVEDDPRACVGFLIHLQPLEGEGERTPPSEEAGWHAPDTGLRKPALCPRGLPTVGVGEAEFKDLLD